MARPQLLVGLLVIALPQLLHHLMKIDQQPKPSS